MSNNFSPEDLAAIAEIAKEESDPSFSGPQSGDRQRRPSRPFYKLLNPQPGGAALEKPGIAMITRDEEGNKKVEVTDSVRAVLLYASDIRTFKKHGGQVACQSYTGENAAPKIDNPPCRKLDSDAVAAIIGKFRGMDKAKLDERVAQLVDGEGRLSFCAIKTKSGGFIPLCPMARYDEERGQPGPCKPGVALVMWDVDRKRVFKMELTGRSIQDNQKGRSDYQEFRHMLGDKRVPAYAFLLALSPRNDPDASGQASKFYTLGLKAKPIVKADNRKEMEAKAIEARDAYIKSANWVPKERREPEQQLVVPPKRKAEPTPTAEPEVPFADDKLSEDFSFGDEEF